ncbi:MAG: transcriptional repressor [Chloroflexi bacterium]|nr:transcriptional repressor [Chloroflexota bacterium]
MEDQLTRLSAALTAHGYRLTASRQAILAALVACGGHISADDLVERVHQDSPNVGRMTVYRTLDLLCQLNLIRPIYQGTGAAHFVLLHHGHHHHLICGACDKVIEFDDCVLAEIEKVVGQRFRFDVQGHLLEFYGLCEECRN